MIDVGDICPVQLWAGWQKEKGNMKGLDGPVAPVDHTTHISFSITWSITNW